jgi:branched-chain amino acid transport system ATP-binding protein
MSARPESAPKPTVDGPYTTGGNSLLAVRDLFVYYGDAEALDQVSLEVGAGEIVAIVGANGAGKSSLISAIAGIVPPRSGSIRFDGAEISGWPSYRTCNLGIGQVAEGRQIFPSLSVQENLAIGAMLPRARSQAAAALERVYAMFPRLAERSAQSAGTLSGGEQQMLAIGRCLMGAPRMIMFDEPSLGLAPALVTEVLHTIRDLHEGGMTILLVEQNVAASLRLADRAYVLENGRVVLAGSGEELLADPRVREAYLGL